MRFLRLLLLCVGLGFGLFYLVQLQPASAATGTFKQINFQGKVVNKTTGTNIADNSYTFVFTIYDAASGGSTLWTETKSVTVTNGIFQTLLGSDTALPASIDFNTDNIYLGINFNSDGEMSPRVRFAAVPQAFNAQKVAGLTVTDTTGTLTIPSGATIAFAGAYTTTFTSTNTTSITLPTSGTLATLAGSEELTNKTIGSTGLVFSGASTDIDAASGQGLTFQGRAASSFDTTSGNLSFQIAGTGTTAVVQIGAGGGGGTTPDYLALDVKSDTGDPANGAEGYMYYNTADNKFRCYQNSGWTDCIGVGGSSNWTDGAGIIYPNNATLDLFIGGLATSSAKFAFINVNSGIPTASISGNLALAAPTGADPATKLNVYNGGSYGIQTSVGGDAGLTERLTVLNNGNVGIGTTNPEYKLNVLSNNFGLKNRVIYTSNPFASVFGLYNSVDLEETTTNAYGIYSLISGDTGTATNSYALYARSLIGTTNYGLYVDDGLNSGTSSYGIYQSGTNDYNYFGGNVGIGSTAPSQKLDVNGAIRLGAADADNVLNTTVGSSAPSGYLYWGDRTLCDSTGNCGGGSSNWTLGSGFIHPNNPTVDLFIGGYATASAKFAFINVNSGIPTASISGNLALATPTGADPATKLNVYNGGSYGIQTSVGGDVGLTERFTILNNGNVGIGTTSPVGHLHIGAGGLETTTEPKIIVSELIDNSLASNPHSFVDVSRVDRNGNIALASFDASATFIGTYDYLHYAAHKARLFYQSSGTMERYYGFYSDLNMTDSTGEVTNAYRYYGQDATDTSGNATIVNNYGVYIEPLTKGSTENFAIYTGGTTKNYFGGNVGIGTTAPSEKLNIVGNELISAGSLVDQHSALKITATLPGGTVAGYNSVVNVQATSQDSTNNAYPFNMDLLAGATDARVYAAGRFGNAVAGTGAGTTLWSGAANSGLIAAASGNTAGFNFGGRFTALNGTQSVGIEGSSITTKNSGTNIGVIGYGLNGGTSPIQIGGYFGLHSAPPTFTSAALIADNGATSSPIFLGRDNGSSVFVINDGGNIGIGSTAPSQVLDVVGGIRLGAADAENVLHTTVAGGAPSGNLYWGDRTLCDSTGNCGGGSSNWTLGAGFIHPNNPSVDLFIGGTASASAKFAFLNVNSGTPTASIAGNLALAAPSGADPATKLNVYNGGSFGIKTSVGGDVGLTERLTVLNNGNVGIGSTAPATSLDVTGDIGLRSGKLLRLYTSGDSNYNVIYSTAANLYINSGNGEVITQAISNIDFQTWTGGTYNSKMIVTNGGNVGIGTTAPSAKLSVGGASSVISNTSGNLTITPAANLIISSGSVGIGTTNPSEVLHVVGNARFTAVGSATQANDLRLTSDGTLTTNTSDVTMKVNVTNLETNTLDKIMQLNPVSFNWVDNTEGSKDIGFIAQEINEIFPEITFINPTDGKMGVNYSRLPAILTKAIQEQQGEIIQQQDVLATLTASLDKLSLEVKQLDLTSIQDAIASLSNTNIQVELITARLNTLENLFLNASDSGNLNTGILHWLDRNMVASSSSIAFRNKLFIQSSDSAELANTSLLTIETSATEGASIQTTHVPLKLQKDSQSNLEIMGGKFIIDTSGNLTVAESITAKELRTQKLQILGDTNTAEGAVLASSTGKVEIEAGKTSVTVKTAALTENSLIFVSAENIPTAVAAKKTDGETIEIFISSPLAEILKVSWWIIN